MTQFPPPMPPTNPFDSYQAAENFQGPPPGWPKGLGIFSIVWGSLGLVCGVCGLAFLLMMPNFMQQVANAQPAQSGQAPPPTPPDILFKQPPIALAGMGLSVLVVILLIIAGIMTMGRKKPGGLLHILYAVFSLVATGLTVVGGVQHAHNVAAWIQQNPDHPFFAQAGGSMGFGMSTDPTMGTIQAVGLAVVSAIYPLFCLVWFGILKKDPSVGAPEPLV
ncbi:MAG: hypothetical protein SFZ23_02385 [Planctomycetota bacterium]|nr:hypothetical protein [Planctomycetota bacterium]